MKALKFTPELAVLILRGEKSATWRLFDDKDLQVGDELRFINNVTGTAFGTATITSCIEKTLGTLEASDWGGHEQYASTEEMYQVYRSFYGDRVGPESKLKIIHFNFVPLQS